MGRGRPACSTPGRSQKVKLVIIIIYIILGWIKSWMFQDPIGSVFLPTSYLAILTSPSLLWPPAPCPGPSGTPGPPSGPASALRTSVMMFKKVRRMKYGLMKSLVVTKVVKCGTTNDMMGIVAEVVNCLSLFRRLSLSD